MPTFKHSGDLGDIIFSLPAVRALGGGVLCLDPDGGMNEPLINVPNRKRTKLNPASIDSLATLLNLQPYIQEVRHWRGEPVDYNLDEFRRNFQGRNLCDANLVTFGLPLSAGQEAWLAVDQPIAVQDRPLVVARSVRSHSNHDFWEFNAHKLAQHGVFVGHPKEHEIFEYTFECSIPYVHTPTILQLAQVIAGCQQVVCNGSAPHAIAEAMKKNIICEVYRLCPVMLFERPGVQNV